MRFSFIRQHTRKSFSWGDFEILGQRLTRLVTSKYRKSWRPKEYRGKGCPKRKTWWTCYRPETSPSPHVKQLPALASLFVSLRSETKKPVSESLKYNQIFLAHGTEEGKAVSLIKIWTSALTSAFHDVTRYLKIWYSLIAGCSSRRAVSNGFTPAPVLAAACWTGKRTSISYLFLQSVYLSSA